MADATATPQQSGASNPYAPYMQQLLGAKQAYDAGNPLPDSQVQDIYSHLGGDNSVFHTMSTQDMQNFMQQQGISSAASGSSAPQTGTTGTTSSQPSTPAPSSGGGSSLPQQMLQAAQNPTPNINPYAGGETTNIQTPNSGTMKAPEQNGKSYMTSAQLSEAGLQYTKDPNSGILTINGTKINPVGYDPSGNPIYPFRASLNAAGVQDNNIKYDPNTDTVSYTLPTNNANAATNTQGTGQTPQPSQQLPPMPQYNSPLPGFMGQMPQAPNITPYQAPDLSMYYNNLTPLQQFNPDWNQYYQQAYNQLDPAVQGQIQTLNTKQGQDITKADEGLNAKGIFNSGIAVQMENQIRANTNDQVAKVLMSEQGNLAKVAQQLYMDAFKQWDAGNTQALKNNQMWLTQAMNQAKLSFDEWSKTQGLTMQQYQYALKAWDDAANLALKDAQFQAQQQLNYEKMVMPYQYQTANNAASNQNKIDVANLNNQNRIDVANLNNITKINIANLDNATKLKIANDNNIVQLTKQSMINQAAWDRAMIPYTQGMTPYQKAQVENEVAKASGYILGPDGNYHLTEQARHDQATEANQANSNKLKFDQMMGYVTGPDGKQYPTLDAQKFAEVQQNDLAKAHQAILTAQNNQDRNLLQGYNDQLINVQKDIARITSATNYNPNDPATKDSLSKLYDTESTIMDNIDKIQQKAGKPMGG